ncbi:MAG: hypothetical protein QF637_04195 [Acidimicrobiales bacterium]|jgi:hypothetical protein|nr:hypothetical protein [Acidimicrobiales bacterium]
MSIQNGGLRGDIDDLLATLRAYLKQETIGPLRGLGRYLTFGLVGTICFTVGGLFLILATIRTLQATTDALEGNLSFVPYLGGVITCAVLISVTTLAMKRDGRRHSGG